MRARLTALVVLCLVATACGGATQTATPAVEVDETTTASDASSEPQEDADTSQQAAMAEVDQAGPSSLDELFPSGATIEVRELARRPHDTTAFTQGLEFDGDQLFESRGLFASEEDITLTEIDPADGTTIRSVERATEVGDYFAEGLTVVDDRIIQLTWRSTTALVYDRDTLEKVDEYVYEGEGWGICDQPDRLIMSDGTPTLTHRDIGTFEVMDEVTVTLDGEPVDELNELECVGDLILANIWNTDRIVVIDPDTGEVRSVIEAPALADPDGRFVEQPQGGSVLNGIAYDEVNDIWLLTGKRWPFMFEVEFVCTSGCAETAEKTHFVRQSLPGQQ